ncbi:xanthine dehydrogenase family protein molybdopterin-binding subunit [Petroclostridium sp. X23]|uniref:xanthine dehydrogenase family protein molybdopterin-binding subunit n=1 Tax=Petroclostridium sp. X23 TaxID=3045146 RepID=UPI0024ACF574|nr:xanthine dehydrogenase family protein molybdopterin-binding subunit [Petroclostridium sp. X23]WHH60480.1 xanthine dehydrogenase family protein molybdopterin-binding subunit [Petroclostridium sp. X23]
MVKIKPFRTDAYQKVTGNAKFTADFYMPGMLYAKILWPKYPAAKIIKIDTAEAETLPGVERIITRKDITGPNKAAVFEPYDRPVLVGEGEEAKFLGDALAIVVAETEEIAYQALDFIKVEYLPLPSVNSFEEAQQTKEPCSTYEIKKGDVEEGFSKADLILEEEYTFPMVEHAPIEPEAGHSFIDGQGVINVCFGSQNLGRHHRMICKSLGLPFQKVRLYSPYVGGGFGGKHCISVQIHLTLAAHVVKKPVKLVWTREESFIAGSKRHDLRIKLKIGLSKEGKLLAVDGQYKSAAGPYLGYSERTVYTAVRYLCGPYWTDHLRGRGEIYHTTNNEAGAFRGFGSTESTFAMETLLNRAARKLNISPQEIRRVNYMKKDEIERQYEGNIWKMTSDRVTVEEALENAIRMAGPKPQPGKHKKVGRGIAVAMPMFGIGDTPGYRGTGADMTMYLDGSVNVRVGFAEIGQGITGVITRLTSQILNIDEEKVSIIYCDSHTTPKAGSLGDSQATFNCGNAVISAAGKLKERLEDTVKEMLKTDEKVEFRNLKFYMRDKECVKFEDFMDYCYYEGKNLTVTGWYEGPDSVDKHGVTYMASVVDVEVDEDTGETKVLNVFTAHDIGKVIHEKSAIGQMIGGTVMSLGTMLYEEFLMKDGKPVTRSFVEYVIPTAQDIPEKNEIEFIECPSSFGPMGGKGIGEHALYAPAPAFANAIMDAVGVAVNRIPLTPERLLKAMKKI